MELPNLLYVGDVPIESSVGGSLLLYRLLSRYPGDRLTVAESNIARSTPNRRLHNVSYYSFDLARERILQTRLRQWYGIWLHAKARWVPDVLRDLIQEIEPEAVLSVWHRYSWMTAAALARRYDLPLHLIVHDDAPIVRHRAHPAFSALYHRDFRRVYRQACSRLCVSPYMEEAYQDRYGVQGQILYPSRGWEAPDYDGPPSSVRNNREPVVGYAGTLHTPGFKAALCAVAETLQDYGGKLVIYSPVSPEAAQSDPWVTSNMEMYDLIPPREVIPTLRESADILFVPTPFEGWSRKKNRTNFPSKLTDYTATGLPILMWGPEDASAIRWAQDHSGVAEVVMSPDEDNLRPAVRTLVESAEHRRDLGRTALRVGKRYFSAENAWSTLKGVLSQQS